MEEEQETTTEVRSGQLLQVYHLSVTSPSSKFNRDITSLPSSRTNTATATSRDQITLGTDRANKVGNVLQVRSSLTTTSSSRNPLYSIPTSNTRTETEVKHLPRQTIKMDSATSFPSTSYPRRRSLKGSNMATSLKDRTRLEELKGLG